MVNFFSPNTWQMMTFPNPRNALIPKIPFSCFADFWVRVTSGALGSVSVGFWGLRQLSLFWGEPGGLARGLYQLPPHKLKAPVQLAEAGLGVELVITNRVLEALYIGMKDRRR